MEVSYRQDLYPQPSKVRFYVHPRAFLGRGGLKAWRKDAEVAVEVNRMLLLEDILTEGEA